MKVFKGEYEGGWCEGGLIVVAANSKEEIICLLKRLPDSYLYKDFLYPSLWEEMPMLTATVEAPQILCELQVAE